MKYRYLAATTEGAIQLIAASYLRHGFYWYVTGRMPNGKDPLAIDRKLIAKYQIDLSEWERSRRKRAGLANVHYLRCSNWFVILVSEGHHTIKNPSAKGGEGELLKDCRRVPIRYAGYSISYRRSGVASEGDRPRKWHAHVRMDARTYASLKAHFESIAVHRSRDYLAQEFAAIPYARYAPIRRQLLNLLRLVNERRKQQAFEVLPYSVLNLRRSPVNVYAERGPAVDNPGAK